MNDQRIDLGMTGWRHPKIEGLTFGSVDSIKLHYPDKDPLLAKPIDTRPSIEIVFKKIIGWERDWWLANCTVKEYQKYGVGPWDEYFSYSDMCGNPPVTAKWPEDYRWIAVYVVTGGSEGLYLHVDLIAGDKPRRQFFIGKSLSSRWEDCYLSAGRIAYYLGA